MNTKTVIISGSRTITDYKVVENAIKMSPWYGSIDTVFVGDAKGIDALVVQWCKENGITYRIFKAKWKTYGKGAGPIRNEEMIMMGGEALIAIWDGESRGTADMIRRAKTHQLPKFIYIHNEAIFGMKVQSETEARG